MSYSEFNGRELDLTFSILNLINNALDADETVRQEMLSKNLVPIVSEFMGLDSDSRHEMLNAIYREVNFKSYAESRGNPNMADALMKVADDLAKMDAKALRGIAEGGLSKVTEK